MPVPDYSFAARCKDSSSTVSTADYVLNQTSTAGWKNFNDAITEGILVDGQTVTIIAIDTTVTGVGLCEVVTGVYDDTAKTISRDTVHQPASIISWGVGTRDIYLIHNPHDVARLANATFTGLVTVLLAGTEISAATETGLMVQRSGSSNDAGISVVSHTSGSARLNLGDTANEKDAGLVYDNSTGALTVRTANGNRLSVSSSGVLANASSLVFPNFAAGNVTRLPFYQGTTPTGWTRITGIEGRAARFSDAGGGSDSGVSGRQDIMSLTVSTVNFGTQSVQAGAGATVYDTVSNPHDHTLLIRYLDFLLASMN